MQISCGHVTSAGSEMHLIDGSEVYLCERCEVSFSPRLRKLLSSFAPYDSEEVDLRKAIGASLKGLKKVTA